MLGVGVMLMVRVNHLPYHKLYLLLSHMNSKFFKERVDVFHGNLRITFDEIFVFVFKLGKLWCLCVCY